jgi:hypothetical protein
MLKLAEVAKLAKVAKVEPLDDEKTAKDKTNERSKSAVHMLEKGSPSLVFRNSENRAKNDVCFERE